MLMNSTGAARSGADNRYQLLLTVILAAIFAAVWLPPVSNAAIAPAGVVIRADLDGTNVHQGYIDQKFTPPYESTPNEIAVSDTHVYLGYGTENIGRAPISGGRVDLDFITGTSSWLGGVAVDSNRIYWSQGDNRIGRADIDGSNVEQDWLTGFLNTGRLALASNNLFVRDWGLGHVGIANTTNGTHTNNLWNPGTTYTEIAASSEHLFFINFLSNSIARSGYEGNGLNSTFIDVGEYINDIAVFGDHIYWTSTDDDGEGHVGRAGLDGSNIERRLINKRVNPSRIAVNGSGIFWLEYYRDAKAKIAKVKLNKKKGTAKVTVTVNGDGRIKLAGGSKVKSVNRKVDGWPGKVTVNVKPAGKLKKQFAKLKRGKSKKARVKLQLEFIPDWDSPVHKSSKRISLTRKR